MREGVGKEVLIIEVEIISKGEVGEGGRDRR